MISGASSAPIRRRRIWISAEKALMAEARRISFARRLSGYVPAVELPAAPVVEGRRIRTAGVPLEAEGLKAEVGSRCVVINETPQGEEGVEAEVVGLAGSKSYLMPVDRMQSMQPGAREVPSAGGGNLPKGSDMHGRVLVGIGLPPDGMCGFGCCDWVSV